MSNTVYALIPAAGVGQRALCEKHNIPKQYQLIGDRSMLVWSIEALLQDERITCIWVAVSPQDVYIDEVDFGVFPKNRVRLIRTGGDTRAKTVFQSLKEMDLDEEDWVLVHDAARPALSKEALTRLIDHVFCFGRPAILGYPSVDTLKRVSSTMNGRVVSTVDRSVIWQAQTPQMMPYGALLSALSNACLDQMTDEASALEGVCQVDVVLGERLNQKVTWQEDFQWMQWYLVEKRKCNLE